MRILIAIIFAMFAGVCSAECELIAGKTLPKASFQRTVPFDQMSNEQMIELATHEVEQYLKQSGYMLTYYNKTPAETVTKFLTESLARNRDKKSAISAFLIETVHSFQHSKGGTLSGYSQESVRETLYSRIVENKEAEYGRPNF